MPEWFSLSIQAPELSALINVTKQSWLSGLSPCGLEMNDDFSCRDSWQQDETGSELDDRKSIEQRWEDKDYSL